MNLYFELKGNEEKELVVWIRQKNGNHVETYDVKIGEYNYDIKTRDSKQVIILNITDHDFLIDNLLSHDYLPYKVEL